MATVLRIIDRFMITGKGLVYMVKHYNNGVIQIGDVFFDLKGNKFVVKEIEMFRRKILTGVDIEDLPIGLLFDMVDGVEAEGTILLSDLEDINFIFCNHPLYPRRVDEDYEEEYQAAGLRHACALFSYENLEHGKLDLYGEVISGLAIYRGWMMKPDMYKDFYNKLEERGIILINTPEEYERYHMLPGWYNDFKEYTAETVWENGGSLENALLMIKGLEGAYIVKDYVKSRKHEWYDACFISEIADEDNAGNVISNFITRQAKELVGGVVLRRFENLKKIGFHEKSGMPISEEYRVFVYAGRIHSLDVYWQGDIILSNEEKQWIATIAKKIRSNFVTVDLARREDGKLIIMELGDGQVSGLQQIKVEKFYGEFDVTSISIEDLLPEGAVVLAGDPMPNVTIEEMRSNVTRIKTTQDLVDAYAKVCNKFWFVEDDLYDFTEGTAEYEKVRVTVDSWGKLMDELDDRIMKTAEEEGLLAERQPNSGTVKQLEVFMGKYGYRNGCGWWVKSGEISILSLVI